MLVWRGKSSSTVFRDENYFLNFLDLEFIGTYRFFYIILKKITPQSVFFSSFSIFILLNFLSFWTTIPNF